MPQQLTYPGVYIEEIPSGVRTISGVATSIAAFIGWAKKGPIDKAQRILSWQDFERYFEGLMPGPTLVMRSTVSMQTGKRCLHHKTGG